MSWVTVLWSMIATVCATFATIQFVVWLRSPNLVSSLLFSVSAFATAILTLFELQAMRASSAVEYGEAMRWMHLSVAVVVVGLVWFVRSYLGTGRAWLAWTVTGLRMLVLVPNFLGYPNATFSEITGLTTVSFLGEVLSVPVGEPNPWRMLINTCNLLFVLYVVDAAAQAWKQGDRIRGVTIGSAVVAAAVLAAVFSQLMVSGLLPGPLVGAVYLLVVAVMGWQMIVDLFRMRQLAQDLRDTRERLDLIAQTVELGLWDWEIRSDRLWVNEQLGTWIVAGGSGELTLDAYLQRVIPEDREATQQTVLRALGTDNEFNLEHRVRGADGKTRWIAAHGKVETDAAGKPLRMRGVAMDVTQQKESESELQKHRTVLAHNQRIFAMGQLSAALTHELNQPLGAILRNAEAGEMILDQTSPDLAELREIISDIQNDDRRAVAVIDSMGALLRHRRLRQELTSVRDLVESVVSLLKVEARTRNVALEIEIDSDLPWIFVDRVQLQQVLLNLLLNGMDALDAKPEGSRVIRISAARSEDGRVEMAVSDNGPGIDQEQLAHLFEPFVTSKSEGAGIGLAISQTIIEAHDGWISGESHPDGGACFRFSLPAVCPGTPA